MNDIFGSDYSSAYDSLYSDKDYGAECDIIEKSFVAYSQWPVQSILDLGCGTGGHALRLAERGFHVTGVDRSVDMLSRLKQKATALNYQSRLSFSHGDIRSISLGRNFDAAIMMFAVLGYQLTNNDVLATLQTARRHLRTTGLLVFDAWYGPAVLAQRPSQRVRTVSVPEGRYLRISTGELEPSQHLCKVDFHVFRFRGDHIAAETKETHLMRYFFPKELELLLDLSSFTLTQLKAFPEVDRDPDERSWNVLCIARAA
jgi:SAM-dependent methyltransferase